MIPKVLYTLARELNSEVSVQECPNERGRTIKWGGVIGRVRGYKVVVIGDTGVLSIGLLELKTDLGFSLNQRCWPFEQRLRLPGIRLPCVVYGARRGQANPYARAAAAWLRKASNRALLLALELDKRESLAVSSREITLAVRPHRANLAMVHKLCDIADTLPKPRPQPKARKGTVDGLSFKPEKLPEDLRSLAPLIRRYAIADDELRGEKIAKATPAARKRLMAKVVPLFPRINAYLDSLAKEKGPIPDEALLLGYLAEGVAELQA
jgi:hypothetical protein